MISFYAFLPILFYPSAVKCQCYSCDKFWNTDCKPRVEGFHCDPNTIVATNINPLTELSTMYTECSLPHHNIKLLKDFCCVFSPQIGCNVALNPVSFVNKPSRYCTHCFQRCNCTENVASLPQAWHWGKLCIMSSLIYLLFSPKSGIFCRNLMRTYACPVNQVSYI
ncbi:PREDICTED: uncharacterized protein LOC108615660 [Drosophila arizonae]|uniref:Uncharacterized protein LOC108615660 n=1 Tax=Drosophila arizonae TaxID=7263 RepID=A0ABM1PF22_DROAR|nr:PREDICTED: uncharacterized protein LOC108615660 [Drosophila arizonae]XP_017865808.1 PREDICTED: uncharacterized protein LOC108615660 [Drosophila arizonae]